jgi:isochorismate synthase
MPPQDVYALEVLRQAQAVARRRDAVVVARVVRSVEAVCIESLLRSALYAGLPVMAWQCARTGAAFLALDRLAGFGGVGLDTCGMKAALERVQSALVKDESGPASGPLAVFGLPFDGHMNPQPDSSWGDWPRGVFNIPVAVWSCSGAGEQWRQTAHVAVHGSDDVQGLLAQCWPALKPTDLRAEAHSQVGAPLESEQAWMARVRGAAQACVAGPLRKVVLARAVRFAPSQGAQLDAAATFAALAARAGGATGFALSPGGGRAFVGATPETLAVVRGRRVVTGALAGTAPRAPDAVEDAALGEALLHSGKDAGEHQAVVDGIRAALGPLCTVLSGDAQPRLRRLATVQHLETRFEGQLRPKMDLLGVVQALHPTPALGGAPSDEARAWLRRTEHLDRGQYAAPLGWVGPAGDGVAVVGIRAALVDPLWAVAFSGAGIVASSDAAAEWRETELKLGPIRDALRAVVR